ncbi:histidine triad nucleotide-binding protein [Paenibacillus hodogayensis]|uniref:Histidine triad nucleotide-binding protein n=1 Tax=Paenibacillus hodogayensis TaxID=279208 RepID=A0ABV5VQK0_9BACL
MDCIFCKIVKGEIPSRKVYETDNVLAFHDIQPAAPTHALVIPKKHIASMNEAGEEDAELLGEVLLAAKRVAEELGIAESGYRLINNVGSDGGQVVYHIHVHVLGGEKLGGLNVRG